MPPKKQSQEDKERQFEDFKKTEEYKQYWVVVECKDADPEIKGADASTSDISSDWSKFCVELFKLLLLQKYNNRAKSFDQSVIRTMFFERLNDN